MQSLFTQPQPFRAVIRDDQGQQWLSFADPIQLICTDEPAAVVDCLNAVDAWVARGYYAVGCVSYEAAAGLRSDFQVRAAEHFPLVWFAICREPGTVSLPQADTAATARLWRPQCRQRDYEAAIDQIHQAIAAGETYQVNFTYPLHSRVDETFDAWALFCQLNDRQQGRYGAFIETADWTLCSVSPELFYTVDGDIITTRPMKGTAARGATPAQDRRVAEHLQSCPKNRAENLMIVDMVRNDLGQVADTGTVTVRDLFALEGYPTVWQLTTTIEARLAAGKGLAEQFRALFPCASITGAPKKNTMAWIRRLETQPRGIYTGAIGFVAPQGRSQFNVAIRTVVYDHRQRQLSYGVGGGIVWDSRPEAEWRETRIKAQVLPGVGNFRLLETLLWQPHGGYAHLDYHLQRLENSASELGFPLDRYQLRQQLIEEAAARGRCCWRVRCLLDSTGQVECQFFVFAREPQLRAVRLRLAHEAVDSADPWLRHKTDQRQRYDVLREHAGGGDDVLMYNERGEITETTIANVVVYKEGMWLTPPLSSGLLPGTLRQKLLDDRRIREQVLFVDDLAGAQIYLINSLRGWRWAQLEEDTEPCRKC
jgi:para-aminobenzoate synthetase/4-amino-4-deoxychorismate lyase